jgi:hypothetical protein
MHAEIERIIMDILEFYGFKVCNVKNRIISAEGKHAEEIFVSYALPDDAAEDILLAYIAVVRRMKAYLKIFIDFGARKIDERIQARAKEHGVVVIPRTNIENEIGRILVARALKDNSTEDASVNVSLQYSPEERFFSIFIDKEAIEHMGEKVSAFNYELRFTPVHIFTYTCEIIHERTQAKKNRSGIVVVDAINGQIKRWSKIPEVRDKAGMPGILKDPVITCENAKAMVTEWIMNAETRETEPVEMKVDNLLIIEKNIERPAPETLALNYLGIFYLPIWYVEGSKGALIVNAADGTIIDLEYFEL